jgi:hypothetical protein
MVIDGLNVDRGEHATNDTYLSTARCLVPGCAGVDYKDLPSREA